MELIDNLNNFGKKEALRNINLTAS